jgi:hypothetical protein
VDAAVLSVETDSDGAQVLKISNLGSSGCDGVSIDNGDGGGPGQSIDGGSLVLAPLSAGGAVLPGATFSVTIDAFVQGSEHEGFASITATKGADGAMDILEFGCDPNLVNVVWYYQYLLDGQVVAQGDPNDVQIFQVGNYFDLLSEVRFGNGPASEDGLDGDGISEIMVGIAPGLAAFRSRSTSTRPCPSSAWARAITSAAT